MLSYRQIEILYLLIHEQTFIPINTIANQLGVSPRTIQYDIAYIEQYAETYHYNVSRNKAAGIKVTTANTTILNELEHNLTNQIHFSKDERLTHIALKLFETTDPVSTKQLAHDVNVSRRTIADDIKMIQAQLDQYHLKLNYVHNKGFNIIGEEDHYRKAYAHFIHQYMKQAAPFIEADIFNSESIALVRRAIIKTLNSENYHLVQSAIDGLIYHILIAIQRLNENFSFDIPINEIDKWRHTNQYAIASKMIENLERSCSVTFPESEIIFITLHLLGSKMTEHTASSIAFEYHDLSQNIHEFITCVSQELGIDMSNDHKLHTSLLTHIKPAIHRIKYDMIQANPLKQEVYKRYPQVVDAISKHISTIEKDTAISFNEDELTFIAIHFASSMERGATNKQLMIKVVLLCGSGIGTSQLLKSKLNHLYPEFNIWDAYSIYQLDEKQLIQNNIDYVISTVPCDISVVPVINVDPFINEQSRQKLNQLINDAREKRVIKMATEGKSLADLLPEHRISVNTQSLSINEAVTVSVQPLIKDDIVGPNYIEAILNQFEQFGSYMVISPHISLIHAGTEYVHNGVGFSLTYFTEGVEFGSKANDPVYLVITLATDHPNAHLKALGQLSELLSNELSRQDFLDGKICKIKQHIAVTKTKEV
ncbi:TPA: BglG family transcription antiterminator [Staphylococcus aureus]|uniref:BglG family transcription antiterminator n=1 Tax=Staphylococcus aureus TaxID=1280 RepID=UPI0002423ACE|nr:BglG family transcription antiterminator [Staphylococcus aureus]ALH98403.1 transcription antiterminator BglG [Staphylococcus aureus]EHM57988.1 phosphoenolpyruvate-dependent sugar PTS family porter, EIIA 2 [Staphylococcus aureus subsp. aureus 21202]MBO8774888.1 BglG family transcription antiterminator [Staphylococcus aureus]MCS4799508.1 BglG family transcription antiterminator [Staphylococcus aureus]MCS4889568.1 BglG family transcription antiterminator [Staphylococcus aureus]